MGDARATPCAAGQADRVVPGSYRGSPYPGIDGVDNAQNILPLVHQQAVASGGGPANTTVVSVPQSMQKM